MAELADVTVLNRPDGAVNVTAAGGYAMVVGASSYAMTVTPQPPSGFVQLSLADHDVTARLTSGRIGGLIGLRDEALPRYQARLDQLAYDVATQVNARHTAGFDATGGGAGSAGWTGASAAAPSAYTATRSEPARGAIGSARCISGAGAWRW